MPLQQEIEYISRLLFKELMGQLNSQEAETLRLWKSASPANQLLADELSHSGNLRSDFNALQHIKQRADILLKAAGVPVREVTTHITHRVHFLKTSWFRYAAAIILVFGAAAYLWFNNNDPIPTNPKNRINPGSDIAAGSNKALLTLANGQQIVLDSAQGDIVKQGNLTVINLAGKLKYEGVGKVTEYNTISTPKGGQYQVLLPDGSKVWLNAASSIKFPTAFTNGERKVFVTGEVYMEVAKNLKQPFFANANNTQVQVLGTSFNINAYPNEDVLKTTLIEGAVRVLNNNKAVILNPGEQLSYNTQAQRTTVQTVDVQQIVAWKNGFFNFENASLQGAMRQLERWYDINVVYEGKVPAIHFLGKLNQRVPLSVVLEGLKGLGLHFRMEERKLIVLP